MSDPNDTATRATLIDQPEGFQVVVPAPRSVIVIAFLCFWLTGWVAGESFALSALLADRVELPVQLFLGVWLAFWTLGGLAAIWLVLFQLAGRERLVVAADELRLRREVFGLGRWMRFRHERIRELRVLAPAIPRDRPIPPMVRGALRMTGLTGGGILIRVEGRRTPLRFGTVLTPEESAQVVTQLRQRHPFPSAPPPASDSEHAA